MDKKERALAVIEALKEAYPDALCALHYKKDYELMIAVRLSAQCTDERVNLITPAPLRPLPTLEAFAQADIAEVETMVHSCGFYRHKARDIVLACQMLLERFGGKVPGTMEELLTLPGVGRKTANLLLGDLYQVPGSVVCDTHCNPHLKQAGACQGKEPEKVEEAGCVRSCPRRRALISATGLCSMAGRCARRAIPSVGAAPWRPTVQALPGRKCGMPLTRYGSIGDRPLSASKKSFRHAVRILKLSKKF